jgi:hypothetical protein
MVTNHLPRLTRLALTGHVGFGLGVDATFSDDRDSGVTHVSIDGTPTHRATSIVDWGSLNTEFRQLSHLELANCVAQSLWADVRFPNLQSLVARDFIPVTLDVLHCPQLVSLHLTGLSCGSMDHVWQMFLSDDNAPLVRHLVLSAHCHPDSTSHDMCTHGADISWDDVAGNHLELATVDVTASRFTHEIVSELPYLASLRRLHVCVGNVGDVVASMTTEWAGSRDTADPFGGALSDKDGRLVGTLDGDGWHLVRET